MTNLLTISMLLCSDCQTHLKLSTKEQEQITARESRFGGIRHTTTFHEHLVRRINCAAAAVPHAAESTSMLPDKVTGRWNPPSWHHVATASPNDSKHKIIGSHASVDEQQILQACLPSCG